jgi:hypothetical protein
MTEDDKVHTITEWAKGRLDEMEATVKSDDKLSNIRFLDMARRVGGPRNRFCRGGNCAEAQ